MNYTVLQHLTILVILLCITSVSAEPAFPPQPTAGNSLEVATYQATQGQNNVHVIGRLSQGGKPGGDLFFGSYKTTPLKEAIRMEQDLANQIQQTTDPIQKKLLIHQHEKAQSIVLEMHNWIPKFDRSYERPRHYEKRLNKASQVKH